MKNLPGARVKQDEERAYLDVCHRTVRERSRVESILRGEHFFDPSKRPTIPNQWELLRDKVWNGLHKEISGASIMSALRDHLADIQQNNCCYCGQPLLKGGHARQLDHVLPSSIYPRFAFHFWNLAVACERCNRIKTNKGYQNVSRRKRNYPEHVEFTNYFHPRFHPYEAHVRFVVTATQDYWYIVYVGRTHQGRQLISDVLNEAALEMTRESNNPAIKLAAATIRDAVKTQGPEAEIAILRFEQAIRNAIEAGAA